MVRRIEKVVVTPEIAAAFLSRRKPGQIKRFDIREAMSIREKVKANGYREGNDLPAVDIDGDLCNGQHRMWLIVDLEITVTMHMIFDAGLDEFGVIDCHRTRNRAMQFCIAGVDNHTLASTATIRSMEFIHNRLRTGDANYLRSRLSDDRLVEYYRNSKLLQGCVASLVIPKSQGLLRVNAPFYKAVFSSVDPFLWQDFFDKLNGVAPTTSSDVEFQLRSRLLDTSVRKLNQIHRDALTIIAWNYRVANRKVRVLAWDKAKQGFPAIDGIDPELFAKNAELPVFPAFKRND